MKQLVQVVSYYNPPHMGGMETRARERAERLAEVGWTVQTLTSSEQTYPHTAQHGKVTVRYLRSWEVARTPIIFSLPLALFGIPKDSIVQVETAIAYVPEVTALICRMRNIPYIARMPLDSTGHTAVRRVMLDWYQRTVLRWVFKNATKVIVLTEDDASVVRTKYQVDSDKIRLISNATAFVPLKAPRTNFHQPFRLLFVGRVAMQKNVPLLLEALRFFLDSFTAVIHLDVVGDGEDMQRVQALVEELRLAEYVDLQGYVTGPDLEHLFEEADALVLPSSHETLPMVILEAMAKGLPMVAGNIPGVRTVIADDVSGLLVDLTKEGFADAFHRLIAEPGLHARLSGGALESAKRYTWDATVAAYSALYDEMLEGASVASESMGGIAYRDSSGRV